jgi:hypothetical protein
MQKNVRRTERTRQIGKKSSQSDSNLNLKIVPQGPDTKTIRAVSNAVLQHPSVRKILKRARYQLLFVELIEPTAEGKPVRIPKPADRYRATIYDYTNNRTILVDGHLKDRRGVEVSESGNQPLPSNKEFHTAVKILLKDPDIGPAIREKRLQPYTPMPPLIDAELPDGRVERTIAVGLLPSDDTVRHEIVGVNMIRRTVDRYENDAPQGAEAHNPICGLLWGNLSANPRTMQNAPGQVWVTVTQGNTVLWKFLAVRPAATKGPGISTRGTGVELRFVDYRGKRVLYRAHVPILNVHYDPGGCGPYRDWQNEEGMIQATGKDIGSTGFRLCPTPAQTILDTGSDAGNFLGVAIYVQGQEVVLVSEMEASWYRYISEWRLHANGTIRPRFGFSAAENSCVCTRHHHHPYWRFDFDIRTAGNNAVREFNDPPIIGSSNWHTKNYEIRRPRDPAHKRKWRVENTLTGEGYEVIPGQDDGVATTSPDWPYPRGDVWILRYHGSEIDDGIDCTTGGPNCQTEANLDQFINGELINNHDVVIWYAAHVTHDLAAEPTGTFGHIAGPELKPVNW